MSCLSRVGCVTVAALFGAGAWWLYGGSVPAFLPKLGRVSESGKAASSRDARPIAWASLKDADQNAGDIIARLEARSGPAYVTVTAADLAAVLSSGLSRALPASASSAGVAIDDDLVRLRAVIPLRELGGDAIPSLIGGVLTDRDTVEMAGTLDLARTGVAEYRVRELRVRSIDVPPRLIPPLMRSFRNRARQTDSLADDAVGIPLPKSVADLRVARGTVTLYKTAPKP